MASDISTPMKNQFFAQNVKVLRKQLGLSIDELGVAIGLSGTSLRGIEKGKTASPSFIHVGRMARLFGVDPHQLFEQNLTSVDESSLHLNFMKNNFTRSDWEYLRPFIEGRRTAKMEEGRFRTLLMDSL